MSPRLVRLSLILAVYAVLVAAGNFFGAWASGRIEFGLAPGAEPMVRGLIILSLGLYVLLMALPFIPGLEIGIGLIAMLGPEICPIVYLCTVAALSLSFLVGWLVPERMLIQAMDVLRLRKARDLVSRLEPLDPGARLAFLSSAGTSRFIPSLLKFRYVALAVLLNVPGNTVIGGGGGIGLTAGLSRLMSFPKFLLTVCLAVAPVPLGVTLAAALG